MSGQLAVINPAELTRQASDVAGVCKEIVLKCAMTIQDRKYVKVEGWQSIATAHGCIAASRDVERVEGGFRAIGEVRRMSDGVVLVTAEGFVGEDETTWFGGEAEVWDKVKKSRVTKTLPKRPDYAIRAMAQTRAISRACRSAFAHVVVLMDAGLSTTPAEEVPAGGFRDDPISDAEFEKQEAARRATNAAASAGETPANWRDVVCHWGKAGSKLNNKRLGDLNPNSVKYIYDECQKKDAAKMSAKDKFLFAAAAMAVAELFPATGEEQGEETKPKFKGDNHEKLHDDLVWENIELEDFMGAARDFGALPKNATNFFAMTEETATKFVGQFADIVNQVRDWKAKKAEESK